MSSIISTLNSSASGRTSTLVAHSRRALVVIIDGIRRRHSVKAVVRTLPIEQSEVATVAFAGLPPDAYPDKPALSRVDQAIKRMIKRHPEIFRVIESGSEPPPDAESQITDTEWEIAARIQQLLRKAWEAPDGRARDWFIFKARDSYHFQTTF
jgi:hypothetical protein